MGIAIVTGASSGMGAEFCRRIDGRGLDSIWMIARRRDRLESLTDELATPARVLCADLSTHDGVDPVLRILEDEHPDVSMLINCAGFGRFGNSWEMPKEDTRAMIGVNVSALVDITNASIPLMSSGSSIVEVCSASAYLPLERLNVYASTKAFVHSYCTGLRNELRGSGIRVLEVSPGWVDTDFIPLSKERDDVPAKVFAHTVTKEQVVSQAMRDLDRGGPVSLCGRYDRFQVFVCRHMPRVAMSAWKRSLE